MNQNEPLRRALDDWLRAALPVLQCQLGPEPIDDARVSREYGKVIHAIVHPDTGMMSVAEAPRLREAAREALQAVPVPMSNGDSRDGAADPPRISLSFEIVKFVVQYLVGASTYSFVPDVFAGTYDQLEQYIYDSGSIHFRSTVDLWNARSEVDRVELDPRIVLRPTHEEERRQSEQDSLESGRFSYLFASPPTPEVVLELRHRAGDLGERLFPEIGMALSHEIDRAGRLLLRGLRLIKPGQIALGAEVSRADNRILGGMLTVAPGPDPSWIDTHRSNPYLIDSAVARELVDLWPRLERGSEDPVLSLALRRFEGSYDRATTEDRLIDYWIALEALFVPGGGTELSFRASLRIAWLLGQNREERAGLFEMAKRSYRLRSKVVHGERLDPKQGLETTTGQTESLLRRALRKCMVDGTAPTQEMLEALTLG